MNVNAYIKSLVLYGKKQGLLEKDDMIYARNQLLERLHLDEYVEPEETELILTGDGEAAGDSLETILKGLCDYAVQAGLLQDDTVTQRDLFDTKLMNCLMPRPCEVIRRFDGLCDGTAEGAEAATDYFYKLSRDSDYIRRYRVKKDLRWKTETPYGALDITINLSKPEKDPRDIAAAKMMKQSGYPKCLLCIDNVGYAGRSNHPARDNHRIIPLVLDGEDWGFQYSPYVYYNEHCIVFNQKHVPMKISDATFRRLFDFVQRFPHYILGSNADLPIVGGSILTHDHFQGGNYAFPMAKAGIEQKFEVPDGFEGVWAGIVKWPLSVLRISGMDPEKICRLASKVLAAWRVYTDEAAFVLAETDGEPHNTITPIARCRDGVYELDLVLRNNITTEEHPMGVYHPHAKLHHIKKENIGLIEVMGLAVLPARLKAEMADLEALILKAESTEAAVAAVRADAALSKHADWTAEWLPEAAAKGLADAAHLGETIRQEIGKVFCEVLEDAGVYKCTKEGRAAFARFLATVGFEAK
ncbi:MAG: UDP-glucose--hexose-1-phosphate uridylyltransferase [Eubacteriales bacterium]|nr:UDP-glucose--hexose-1-phosphate uridylyltransferase [Eubacteriales bacterium]